VFKRGRDTGARQVKLPDERMALVERYMIDADEAETRAHLVAEDQARREDGEGARRDTEAAVEHSATQTQVETAVERTATEKDASAPQPVTEGEPSEVTEDLPVFAWLQGVESAAPTASDWTRELVRAKEARADDPGQS
jgi:hypothetical protein